MGFMEGRVGLQFLRAQLGIDMHTLYLSSRVKLNIPGAETNNITKSKTQDPAS